MPRRGQPRRISVVPGPLAGITVVELASIGPIPFCGMALSDMGCDVVRVDKLAGAPGANPSRPARAVLARGRRPAAPDLKPPPPRARGLHLLPPPPRLLGHLSP